jgi:hypothetical protein
MEDEFMSEILCAEPVKKTSSGIVYTGPCIFRGFLLGTDGVNDPTITIYNAVTAAGEEVIPTCSYDASALGLNGVTGIMQYCENGLYLEITCAGSVEVVPQYSPFPVSRRAG